MDKLVLSLAGAQKEVVLREGSAADIFQYKGFSYKTANTESFIATLIKYGNMKSTVIANNEDSMKAVLDHDNQDRPHSWASLSWDMSAEAKRWRSIMGKQLLQAQFVKFLEREARISGSPVVENLLAQMKGLKINAQIIGDYSMDDRNNYTFMYKIGDLEGCSRIPALLQIHFPMLDGGRTEAVDIEIEFIRPSNATDKPMFLLICPTWDDIMQGSIDYEVAEVRAAFPGWLLIKGTL